MEERKYTFYDRYQKVKYDNEPAEELEVLNTYYNTGTLLYVSIQQRSEKIIPYYSCGQTVGNQ